MYKRITMLFILTILAIGIVACGSNKSATEPTVEPVAESADASPADTDTAAEEQADSAGTDETATSTGLTYPIVDTNQGLCYNNSELIDCPADGEAFYGQDAQYTGNAPSYTDNGDGTITDNVTGLIWAQDLSSYTMEWSEASGYCETFETGDITDWRLPTVKELWSIRDFSQGWPWIDTDYFYLVGDGSEMGRHHSWTSNAYLVESDYQNEQVVGDPYWIVNDWTGHIKAMSGRRFVRCVSGDGYGINDFVDNGDGTVTDNATGLMWAQDDNGEAIEWETALKYAQDATIAGYDDWRLPNPKELQSIADYSGLFPVLDTSVFNLTELTNVVYDTDSGDEIDTQVTYPAYWTSTSNPIVDEDATEGGNTYAWLLAAGYNPDTSGYDLHGAGSIVFDTKAEAVSDGTDFEIIYHHARLVRDGDVTETPDGDPTTIDTDRVVEFEDSAAGDAAGGGGQGPDFADAAATLGVTEEALMEAMGEPGAGEPDFEAVAEALGVSAEELEAALMESSGGQQGGPEGGPPEGEAPEEGAPAEEPADSSEMPADSDETSSTSTLTSPIADTAQTTCYDNSEPIDCPAAGEAFYGQDAQFDGNAQNYTVSTTDDGDETVIDNVTGIIWTKSPDLDGIGNGNGEITSDDKLSSSAAATACEALDYAGYTDWQLPNVKQLYSLMNFAGSDPASDDTSTLTPFIDWDVFDFAYGSTEGERIIDSQYATTSLYTNDEGTEMMFGVNFADGRIKGYEEEFRGSDKTYFVMCMRGNIGYGENEFVDNGNNTITDNATGLMWAQDDSGSAYGEGFDYTTLDFLDTDGDGLLVAADAEMQGAMTWEDALSYIEALNEADYLGYSDWRLPNVKELHSLMDYSKTPANDGVATIDSVFNSTAIKNENGDTDYPFYWSGTTHATNGDTESGVAGAYVALGRAMGYSEELGYWIDVHGAGAQRSDEKTWDGGEYTTGDGPQNDAVRIYHYVRPVRDGAEELEAALMNTGGAPAEEPADSSEMPADSTETSSATYTLNETGQGFCYNSDGENIGCPAGGEAFYGQDAQFSGAAFDFTDNGDGTISDNVTNLLWEQTPNSGPSSWPEAQDYCQALTLGDQEDWRMPSLKELFSISNFSAGWPYLDTTYFDLTVNDSISKDEQYWADNYYVGKTAEGQYDAAFGVNHTTGHIKAYPALTTGPMGKYVRCVSGEAYLINDFVDNGDPSTGSGQAGTITDNATALTWMQADSGEGMDWETALAYAQEMNAANYLGYSDWRLPNVKELQSIVDYDYAPDAQDAAYDGPALDPLFSVSEITNEAGELDYPYYWTSTSSRFQSTGDFYYAWYVAAGRAVDGEGNDSHGAGAVRFDTKVEGGPLGEGGERYDNYVRLVRGGDVTETPDGDPNANDTAPELEFTGAGGPSGEEGGPQMPDFAAAAEQLGVTEAELTEALGSNQGPPDFEAAAETLGVTVEELQAALGVE